MIQPKETVIKDNNGVDRTYIISKVPATDGREIFTQYLPTAAPKIGDYKQNEQLMYKLLSFVAVPMDNGVPLRLTTKALIDNHVPDWETLARLEMAMMEYNTSFLNRGSLSTALAGLEAKAPALITKMLTNFLAQLSQAAKQHSKS